MRSTARLRVSGRGGRSIVDELYAEPPIALRRCGDRVMLVGAAAGPVGGDELVLGVAIGPGARTSVGSTGATIVWPAPVPATSSSRLDVTVGEGATLDWWPEPTISVAGSDHQTTTVVRLGRGASCRFVEELALGRSDEPGGHLTTSLRVEREGVALLHHGERFGPGVPGVGSTVSVGAFRHVLVAVLAGPRWVDPGVPGDTTVSLGATASAGRFVRRCPRDGELTVTVIAVGDGRPGVQRAARAVAPELGSRP